MVESVAEIIDELGGTTAFGKIIGRKPTAVSEMKRSGRIEGGHWLTITEAAKAQGKKKITLDLLARIHSRQPEKVK